MGPTVSKTVVFRKGSPQWECYSARRCSPLCSGFAIIWSRTYSLASVLPAVPFGREFSRRKTSVILLQAHDQLFSLAGMEGIGRRLVGVIPCLFCCASVPAFAHQEGEYQLIFTRYADCATTGTCTHSPATFFADAQGNHENQNSMKGITK